MWDLKTAAFPAEAMGAISDWFNAIATKVPDAKVQKSSPPVCDLSRIQMPMGECISKLRMYVKGVRLIIGV